MENAAFADRADRKGGGGGTVLDAKLGVDLFKMLVDRARTEIENLALAGDWTDTRLPGTIEGAVRSGVTAARLMLAPAMSPEKRRKKKLSLHDA